MKEALIIFAKNPEPGKVKTRIAQTMGHEKALAIYQEMLSHTQRITASIPADKFIYYSSFIDHQDAWDKALYQPKLQQGIDLGERMNQAFQTLFQLGYENICIIGTDCLELTTHYINTAFHSLKNNHAVIGPSSDGGYYLLGLKLSLPTLFNNKNWSTDTVLSDTLNDLKGLSLSYFLLPTLTDIDTEEDWQQQLARTDQR